MNVVRRFCGIYAVVLTSAACPKIQKKARMAVEYYDKLRRRNLYPVASRDIGRGLQIAAPMRIL